MCAAVKTTLGRIDGELFAPDRNNASASARGAEAAAVGAAVGPPSAAPTSHYTDWIIYFTDGAEGESYVWFMESFESGIFASVLVDTTGFASGVAVATNDTSVFFTDY